MKKVFILILLSVFPFLLAGKIEAMTYSPNSIVQYCWKNPQSRFNCQKIDCERKNSNRAFSTGIFGVNRDTTPIVYLDCDKYVNGITVPESLSYGFVSEVLFATLSRVPQLEIVVPLRLLGLISSFFNNSLVQFTFLTLVFGLFPFNILFLLFCVVIVIVRFWRRSKK